MKKAFVIVTVMLATAFVGFPLFAQRHRNNQNMPTSPMFQQTWNGNHGGMHGMDGAMGGHRGGMGMSDNVKVGTVSAVDVKANTITVTDSDGKTFKVSVNPRTFICDSTEAVNQRNALRANPPAPGSTPPVWTAPKVIQIADVKSGDWVSVSFLNTGTTVLDAARIQVVKNK